MKKLINEVEERINRSPRLFISVFLVVVVWVVFGQTLWHDFINFDDQFYVYENPAVLHGLNGSGVQWAFTHSVALNWHPLTLMSHMLDASLYGLHPGGHHLTSVLLHALTVVLLFLMLAELTGSAWRSAFVAAVFAIHPLRAESVAWISERKDVLSGVFFALTLMAYIRYARGTFSVRRYLWVVVLFALGLMAKPMLVTLPFVLLLLDYWPLRRFDEEADKEIKIKAAGRLFMEKVPLLALSGAACVGTMLAQSNWIVHSEFLSGPLRLENAALAYVNYIWQMFYPAKLALLYPHPREGISLLGSILALVLLIGISAGVFLGRRQRPYLLVGWLWYLGMLVPVIGLVQVGMQAHADRYTYLPQIGLYMALAWFFAELSTSARYRMVLRGMATVIIVMLVFLGHAQTAYWFDSETIWRHTLAVTDKNAVAHTELGAALYKKGRMDEALVEFQDSLALKPTDPDSYDAIGAAYVQKGRIDEAMDCFRKALELYPDDQVAHNNLGNVLLKQGRVDEAITNLQEAVEIAPDDPEAYNALANAFLKRGDDSAAIANYQKALEFDADNAGIQNNLASILLKRGVLDQAIAHFQKAVEINPAYPGAELALAMALSKVGQTDEAVRHYRHVLLVNGDNAEASFHLANILTTQGHAGEAIVYYRKTLQLNPQQAEAESDLGLAYLQTGDAADAIEHLEKALVLDPAIAKAHANLATALMTEGRTADAIVHYQKALDIQPQYLEAQGGLAWTLATAAEAPIRNGARAVELAQQANTLAHENNPIVLRILAAAYAEDNLFAEAIDTAQRALTLANGQHNAALAGVLEKELTLYRAGLPFHNAPVVTKSN